MERVLPSKDGIPVGVYRYVGVLPNFVAERGDVLNRAKSAAGRSRTGLDSEESVVCSPAVPGKNDVTESVDVDLRAPRFLTGLREVHRRRPRCPGGSWQHRGG
jgi:hypothetical protein